MYIEFSFLITNTEVLKVKHTFKISVKCHWSMIFIYIEQEAFRIKIEPLFIKYL